MYLSRASNIAKYPRKYLKRYTIVPHRKHCVLRISFEIFPRILSDIFASGFFFFFAIFRNNYMHEHANESKIK